MDEKRKEQFYQNIVYDVWKDTLQDNTFDIDDNFFDLKFKEKWIFHVWIKLVKLL